MPTNTFLAEGTTPPFSNVSKTCQYVSSKKRPCNGPTEVYHEITRLAACYKHRNDMTEDGLGYKKHKA